MGTSFISPWGPKGTVSHLKLVFLQHTGLSHLDQLLGEWSGGLSMVFKATRSQPPPKIWNQRENLPWWSEGFQISCLELGDKFPYLCHPQLTTYKPDNNKAAALYHQEELPFFPVVDAGKAWSGVTSFTGTGKPISRGPSLEICSLSRWQRAWDTENSTFLGQKSHAKLMKNTVTSWVWLTRAKI